MNKSIFLFTILSACLDPLKLLYVALIGFVVPIGLKIASAMHGAVESQTFEMLTGQVGVAFILMVLCLGLAGNTATQSGRGGEYLPLIFSRPVSRAEYVLTKWLTIALIGGALAATQNVLVTIIGACLGEAFSLPVLLSLIVERFLDAGVISAAMILTMLNKNAIFQVIAIIAFYVWLVGQTLPPVSVAGPTPSGVDQMALDATKLMLDSSQLVADLILPSINVYDLLHSPAPSLLPVVSYLSTVLIYLALSVAVTNRREFFYGVS